MMRSAQCSDRPTAGASAQRALGRAHSTRRSGVETIDLSGEEAVCPRSARPTVREQLAQTRALLRAMPRFPSREGVSRWLPVPAAPAVAVATRSMPVPLPLRLPMPLPWASVAASVHAMPGVASDSPLDLSLPSRRRNETAASSASHAEAASVEAAEALREIVMQRTQMLRLVAGVAGRKILIGQTGPTGPFCIQYDARNVLVAAFMALNGAEGISQREFSRAMHLLYRTFNSWLTRYRRNPDGADVFWAAIAPDTAHYAPLLVQQLRASRRLPAPTFSDLVASPLHGRLWQTVNGSTRQQIACRRAVKRA
ncbi:hypothetical protein [Robbsia sp. KACC 23696]|uniref:hypothetical protein n=1 Tax=Robbsia sp. KACC 23696 TaxID=3149231 RepID=UPI00325AC60D